MKVCQKHWDLMREVVEAFGMSDLVAKSGEAALESQVKEIELAARGEKPPVSDFDPLMSMNWHWSNAALSNGGLYIMNVDPDNVDLKYNEGHYCPVCEFEKHSEGFVAKDSFESVAKQMQAYCRAEKLIPPLS